MTEHLNQILSRLEKGNQARLLLVSDSHGRSDGIASLLEKTGQPDLILHLGDHQFGLEELEIEFNCPVIGVAGNCDHGSLADWLPHERLLTLAGHRIFMTHGHHYHVKQGYGQLVKTAAAPPFVADLICFGHTHHQFVTQENIAGRTVWLLNPGSAYPDRHGAHGIWVLLNTDLIQIQCLPDLPTP